MAESTESPVLVAELSRDGGGFLAVELIPKAAIVPLALKGNYTVNGTRLDATLTCTPANLPREKIPCKVTWVMGKRKCEGSGELDVAARTIKATLDIASGGAIGAALEEGAALSVEVSPDVPHRSGHLPVALNKNLPKFFLTLSSGGQEWKTLSQLGTPTLKVGDVVKLKLVRSLWRCHARLRVGYNTGRDYKETFVDFGTGGTEGNWVVGLDQGALLPLVPTQNKIKFSLRLEVSGDGKSYTPITDAAAVHASPMKLESFKIELGQDAARVLETKMDFFTVGGDYGIHASGTIAEIAASSSPPLWVELWAYREKTEKERGVMHPIENARVRVKVDKDGHFRIPLKRLSSDADVGLVKGWKLFAILRAGAGEPFPLLPAALTYGKLRAFNDEDFAVNVKRGICSQEITSATKVTREPAIGTVSRSVTSGLVFSCPVLGSAAEFWSKAKPLFVVQTQGNVRKEYQARYVADTGSAKGTLTAFVAFSNMKDIAGQSLTVHLEPGIKPEPWQPSPNKVQLESFPKIGPVRYKLETDKNKKEILYFMCGTEFFPREAGWSFKVTFRTRVNAHVTEWKDARFKILWTDSAVEATAKDGMLRFRADDAAKVELMTLINSACLKVRVARPPGLEQLHKNPGLTVAPWEGAPEPFG